MDGHASLALLRQRDALGGLTLSQRQFFWPGNSLQKNFSCSAPDCC